MKKTVAILSIVSGAFFSLPFVSAQEREEGKILVKENLVERVDSSLVVNMVIDLSGLEVSSGNSVVCTPVIERGDSLVVLPQLVINGRSRHILYERTGRNLQENNEYELRRHNDTEQSFDYHARIPFRKWMEKSEVSLVTDLCGCGWEALQNDKSPLFPINMAQPVVLKPALAYLVPQAKAVKARSKVGSAFLDFPVNKTTIHPDYRNNPAELQKIRETIESVRNDKYATITEVYVKGYASPEGSYANNSYLAENRAKALLNYVKGLYDFKDAHFTVDFEPEDWEGLERRVQESDLADKAEILDIIHADTPKDWDQREWKLKTLNGGADYRILLRDIYPALRHSDYAVKYTIRNFTVEEAKELIYEDPKQLSLNEMYQVAQTYEPGSDKYNEIFEITVRMYPDDPVSNLNAALAAISTGRLEAAREYLKKAADTPEKQLAEASLLMLEGKLDEAEAKLTSLKGSPLSAQAKENLKQIAAKRNE
ncbi:DUF3868 domain-containing protein [Bacteroides gallinarum]|uniref:DUF3868 domain-containing protein n=1 Tax=Bacteroides gallinarum TaxID=376806 RepID=UPI00035C11D5|nr:DUF3868 domain-containing protein [Bacteroides gallinarum]